MKNPEKLVLVSAASVLLIGIGLFFTNRRERNPEEVTKLFFQSIANADPDAFLSVVDPTEIKRNQLSKEDIRRFLSEQITPYVRVSSIAPEILGDGKTQSQIFNYVVSIDGKEHLMSVSVAKTDSGLRVVLPISSIFMSFISARGNYHNEKGAEKLVVWLKGASIVERDWDPYKIKYLQLSASLDPITIEQFRKWTEKRIANGPPK